MYTLHRKEGEFDFITIFVNAVEKDIGGGRIVLVSVADDSLVVNCGGQFMIAGDGQLVVKASEMYVLYRFSSKMHSYNKHFSEFQCNHQVRGERLGGQERHFSRSHCRCFKAGQAGGGDPEGDIVNSCVWIYVLNFKKLKFI